MLKSKKKRVLLVFSTILIIAIAVFAVLFIGIANNRSYEKYMAAADLSISNGDYESALSALRKAEDINSDDEECLTKIADCYERLGNYDKALETLRKLDITDETIASRIKADESRKEYGAKAGMVTIAGDEYNSTDTSLVLDGRGLDNSVVDEIVQLYALENLSLSENNISDISGLSTLGGLNTLNLKGNNISDISALASLTSLRSLYLDGNPISDYSPLYGLQNLTSLSIKDNSISDTELEKLSEALPNCTINGANATQDVQNVTLGGVTFDMNTSNPLDLSNRGITDISVLSQCPNLTSINLSGNAITDISPLMDIQYLATLNISNNNISDIRPLMGLTSLKELNIANNNVTNTTSLGTNTNLLVLNLDNNPITDFSGLRKLKNLTNLSLVNTGLKPTDISYFTLLTKLATLDITDNPAITGDAFDQLQSTIPKTDIFHSDLVYTFSFNGTDIDSNQTSLSLPNQGISDISGLMQFTSLENINLSDNIISDLYYFSIAPFKDTLKTLDLSNNKIMDLSALSGLTNLETLNLSNNNIYSVTPLYSLQNLRELYIGGNQLTDEQIQELDRNLPNCTIINS